MQGPSRSARRILATVALATLLLAGLAWWVLVLPYRTTAAGLALDCDAKVEWTPDQVGRREAARFERTCEDARRTRRTTALLVGAGVATAAAAVSTVPSRRLTRARL